jgi:hypothetical protein
MQLVGIITNSMKKRKPFLNFCLLLWDWSKGYEK